MDFAGEPEYRQQIKPSDRSTSLNLFFYSKQLEKITANPLKMKSFFKMMQY